MLRKSVSGIALLVLPLAIGVVVILAGTSIFPYFSQGEYGLDPAYPYLFNGMGLIRGFAPGHVDHPGTPLQMLSGIVTYVDWLARSLFGATSLSFEASVLDDPESYLRGVSAILLILNIGAMFYLGLKMARSSGSLAVGLLAQAGYLLFASQLPRFSYVSPEALTIFSAAIVMGLLSPYLFSADQRRFQHEIADPILVGAFLAVGVVSKVTFLPLLALAWLVPTPKSKLICLASLLTFSIVLFGPALGRFSQWFDFMRQIAGHSEYYGGGPAEFVKMSAVPERMLAFWQALPALYVGLGATGLVAVLRLFGCWRGNRALWRDQTFSQAGIFGAIIIVGLALSIKHFGLRYAIPPLAIVPPVMAWSMFHFAKIIPGQLLRQAVVATGVILAATLSIPGIRTMLRNLSIVDTYRTRDLPGLNAVLARHPGAMIVGGYSARTQDYAIGFGLYYVKLAYQKMVVGDRSDRLIYLGGNSLFVMGEGVRDTQLANDLVESGREVLMVLPAGIEPPPKLKVQLLYQIPDRERLFQVLKAGS